MKAVRNGTRRPRAAAAAAGQKAAAAAAAAAAATAATAATTTTAAAKVKVKTKAKKEKIEIKVQEVETASDTASSVGDAMQELEDRINHVQDSWETESLLADAIEELTDANAVSNDPDSCPPDEAALLRHQLRHLGPQEFCLRTVDAGRYTAKKLLSAFGVRPPGYLEGCPDEAYFPILSLAMTRELNKRAKLTRFNTVDDAVELIRASKNIVCLTGAGISTSLGIPDFRSKGTGLYSKLEHLGLSDPQELFDIKQFRADPSVFYSVAKDILPSTDRYTPTHRFIAMLQEKGKLLTNYSQNIDNLEAKAGIHPSKLVQCHGSFATATCIQCGYKTVGETIFPEVKAGNIPKCPQCIKSLRATQNSTKRKRSRGAAADKRRRRYGGDLGDDSDSESEYDMPSAGVMKPDITFFGEVLPADFSRRLTETDREKVDLVVVIGTSLKVTPVSELVSYLPPQVPQIYISRMPVTHINFDIDLLGDCDVVVAELCRRLGWKLEHEMVPKNQKVEVQVEEGFLSRHVFTDTT